MWDNPHDGKLRPSRLPAGVQWVAVGLFVAGVALSAVFAISAHWRRAKADNQAKKHGHADLSLYREWVDNNPTVFTGYEKGRRGRASWPGYRPWRGGAALPWLH